MAFPAPDAAAIGAPEPAPDVAIADQGGAASDPNAPRAQYNDPPPPPAGAVANIPATLTLPSGAFVSVRVNQWLSSDRNQAGDTFYATLIQPLIVDGVVVARKGSTVIGRVSEAHKAGRVEGTSGLGLQLTTLSLVDGSQISVQSQVVDRKGTTSVGRDAAAIGGTTAVGAAIGAGAAGPFGAAVGAGAGAVASTVGVLFTRGRPTEVYPETMLTFRLEAPVTISTARASAAFHYADQDDYGMPGGPPARIATSQYPPRPVAVGGPVYGPYPPYYYSPYYYGPSFGVVIGPGYYGGFRGGFRR
jgi:hypothetical protein